MTTTNVRLPETRRQSILDRSGPVEFTGALLGYSSSNRERHIHDGAYAPRGTKCSACRWFEVKIFAIDAGDALSFGGRYLVHTAGVSIVPGEVTFSRSYYTNSAYEIVETLTVRKGGEVFLPPAAARALAQASQYDEDVRDAYINRAVA